MLELPLQPHRQHLRHLPRMRRTLRCSGRGQEMMVPHYRFRSAVKWVGIIFCALLVVSWAMSMKVAFIWDSEDIRHEFTLGCGAIVLSWRPEGWSSGEELCLPAPGWKVVSYPDESWRPL